MSLKSVGTAKPDTNTSISLLGIPLPDTEASRPILTNHLRPFFLLCTTIGEPSSISPFFSTERTESIRFRGFRSIFNKCSCPRMIMVSRLLMVLTTCLTCFSCFLSSATISTTSISMSERFKSLTFHILPQPFCNLKNTLKYRDPCFVRRSDFLSRARALLPVFQKKYPIATPDKFAPALNPMLCV